MGPTEDTSQHCFAVADSLSSSESKDEKTKLVDFDEIWNRAIEIEETPVAGYVSKPALEQSIDELPYLDIIEYGFDQLITNDEKFHIAASHADFDIAEYIKWLDCVIFDEESAAYGKTLIDLIRPLALKKGTKRTVGSWNDSIATMPHAEAASPAHDGSSHQGNFAAQTVKGSGSLIIVDIDDSGFDTTQLPETLVTRTRSRFGTHHWYYLPTDISLPNVQGTWGELQASRRLALFPGSFVPVENKKLTQETIDDPDLGKYTVDKANPVREFRLSEFPDPIHTDIWNGLKDNLTPAIYNKSTTHQRSQRQVRTSFDGEIGSVYRIPMQDIVNLCVRLSQWWDDRSEIKIPTVPSHGESEQIKHPVHGCNSGTNTGFYATSSESMIHDEDDTRLHCWRCGEQLDPVGLLAIADPTWNRITNIDHCCQLNTQLSRSKIVMKAWVNAHTYGLLRNETKIPFRVIEEALREHISDEDIMYQENGMLCRFHYNLGLKSAEQIRENIR